MRSNNETGPFLSPKELTENLGEPMPGVGGRARLRRGLDQLALQASPPRAFVRRWPPDESFTVPASSAALSGGRKRELSLARGQGSFCSHRSQRPLPTI